MPVQPTVTGGAQSKIRRRRAQETREDAELGPVRLCRACSTWQPDDEEFWGTVLNPGRRVTVKRCRACSSEAARRFRERQREIHLKVELAVVLGPCPCHDCGAPLVWDGARWFTVDWFRHECPKAAAA